MSDSEKTDIELIQEFAIGNEQSFEILYHRHKGQLYGFLNHLLQGNRSEIDEVFSETWIKVLDKLPKYKDQGRFSAWLFKMSRNIFIDRLRREKRWKFAVSLDNDDVALQLTGSKTMEPDLEIEFAEINQAVEAGLDKLPLEQREVFLLRQQNLAFKEIAEIQNCSINTVLGRMQYALKNLRQHLHGVDNGGLIK